jgi:hypothetical protein
MLCAVALNVGVFRAEYEYVVIARRDRRIGRIKRGGLARGARSLAAA